MGVSQVTLRQVSLEHCRWGLLSLQRWCLFLDTKDPGGKRRVVGGREGAGSGRPESPTYPFL